MIPSRTDVTPPPTLSMLNQRALDLVVVSIGIAIGNSTIALVSTQILGQIFIALRDISFFAFMSGLASLLIIVCSTALMVRSLTL